MVRENLSLESTGRRKFALVFSDERWRFKIKREHVLSAHLDLVLIASPSPYGLDKKGCKCLCESVYIVCVFPPHQAIYLSACQTGLSLTVSILAERRSSVP